MNASHVCRRKRQANPTGMVAVGHAPDSGDLHEGVGHRARVIGWIAIPLRDVHNEKDGVQSAGLHPGQVNLLAGRPGAKRIVRLGAEVGGNVHMRVDRKHAGMDRPGLGQQLTFRLFGGGGQRQAQSGKHGKGGGSRLHGNRQPCASVLRRPHCHVRRRTCNEAGSAPGRGPGRAPPSAKEIGKYLSQRMRPALAGVPVMRRSRLVGDR